MPCRCDTYFVSIVTQYTDILAPTKVKEPLRLHVLPHVGIRRHEAFCISYEYSETSVLHTLLNPHHLFTHHGNAAWNANDHELHILRR
jgi:hypothetical protein